MARWFCPNTMQATLHASAVSNFGAAFSLDFGLALYRTDMDRGFASAWEPSFSFWASWQRPSRRNSIISFSPRPSASDSAVDFFSLRLLQFNLSDFWKKSGLAVGLVISGPNLGGMMCPKVFLCSSIDMLVSRCCLANSRQLSDQQQQISTSLGRCA